MGWGGYLGMPVCAVGNSPHMLDSVSVRQGIYQRQGSCFPFAPHNVINGLMPLKNVKPVVGGEYPAVNKRRIGQLVLE